MEELTLTRVSGDHGTLTLPGSKSLSNRALLLAALSRGRTRLYNLLKSDDTARMREALTALGVKLDDHGDLLELEGLGGGFAVRSRVTLDLGNAGTAMRPLCAALAFSQGDFVLTGEPRMRERPIGDLVTALRDLGVAVECLENEGYPPLGIKGCAGAPASHQTAVRGDVSSQFLSALLMAAPLGGGLELKVVGELISRPYVDLTINLMERFGIRVQREGYARLAVPPGTYASPGDFHVEGDASAASYFMAAAAIAGEVTVRGIDRHSTQGDVAFADVLARMGAEVNWGEHEITVRRRELHGLEIDMNAMPDAAMTLVPLCLYTKEPLCIRNIASWRVKETDRLSAMENEMKKLGVAVECGADYIRLDARTRNQEVPHFATYRDHRMAMALSLVAFDRDVVIEDPGCVSKTFPGYFREFQRICV